MIVNGWLNWATRRDGPLNKVYPEVNENKGLVCHSMEGWIAGSLGELDKPSRQASWHFSNCIDGTFYQHYPVTSSCWASGNFPANTKFVAVESEGVAGTPISSLQMINMTRLTDDLGFKLRGVNLFEHNEVATLWSPNAGPTSCPSHRYDDFFSSLEDDNLTPEDRVTFDNLVKIMGGRQKIQENADLGNDFILGYSLEQIKLSEHIANHPVLYDGKVPSHKHISGDVQ